MTLYAGLRCLDRRKLRTDIAAAILPTLTSLYLLSGSLDKSNLNVDSAFAGSARIQGPRRLVQASKHVLRLSRNAIIPRGRHIPITSEWKGNSSSYQWKRIMPEIRSETPLERYRGPTSMYSPVMSIWNGTKPEWKVKSINYALQIPQICKEEITVSKFPSPARQEVERIDRWPTWKCQSEEFDWRYDMTEVAYVLDGEATIIPADGRKTVTIKRGDVVTFPKGMECTWIIGEKFQKHYKFIPDGASNPYASLSDEMKLDGGAITGHLQIPKAYRHQSEQ